MFFALNQKVGCSVTVTEFPQCVGQDKIYQRISRALKDVYFMENLEVRFLGAQTGKNSLNIRKAWVEIKPDL